MDQCLDASMNIAVPRVTQNPALYLYATTGLQERLSAFLLACSVPHLECLLDSRGGALEDTVPGVVLARCFPGAIVIQGASR